MKWFTHIGFSILIFLIIKEIFEITSNKILLLSMIFCILGGLLPDIDIHFKLFSKHRGILHSVIGVLIFSAIFIIIFRILNLTIVAFCFFLGYFFHLFLDSFTLSGVKWFPFAKKSKGSIKTGGIKEKIVSVIVWILVIILTFRAF